MSPLATAQIAGPNPAERPAPLRQRRWLVALGLLLLYLMLLWQVTGAVSRSGLAQLSERGRYQLNLYVSHLRGQLFKYEHLPALLATDPEAREVLRHPDDHARLVRFNRHLAEVNTISGAADVYLMNAQGLTLAASNWNSEHSFVGRDFRWRPYFQQAMAGKPGRYFALGTTSHRRGYYFAFPVRDGGRVLGAMVVKVDLSTVEQELAANPEQLLVTDEDGVLFISTREQWRLRVLAPLTAERRARIEASSRYAGASLEPLPWQGPRTGANGLSLVTLPDAVGTPAEYLMLSEPMPEAGWTVWTLTPTGALRPRLVTAIALTTSAFAALLFLALWLRQRRKRRLERVRCQEEAQHQLERRVEERTAALRRAQDELLHAAKLAVIGQMSTGISHEINQPLAALRSYADNTRLLLEKGRIDEANANLREIAGLTDRIAQITSQLKLFARKSHGQRTPVSLRQAIDNSLSLLRPQLKKSTTEIRIELPEPAPQVAADPVQLEQVLVNLLGNALDAMEKQGSRWIVIRGERRHDMLELSIRDNGPGIPAENLARIFDPFFTTRETGLGLGLSISHRIAEEMGGRLAAANHPEGGALFTLTLAEAKHVA